MPDMRRRAFITLLGGAAAWPLAARAQQRERMRRIGVLVGGLAADDPIWQARSNAFVQGLQERGWSDGRNMRVEYRWGLGDPDRLRKYAAELLALAPDVILATGAPAVVSLQQSNRSVPIVFVNVLDPVGAGYVTSLARPGGNATGFALSEFGLSAKLLELLKQVAPRVARVAVVRHPANPFEVAQFGAIQAVAPSLGVELTPIIGRDPTEMERDITAFGRGGNGGLIVTGGAAQQFQRDTIIAAAANHQLPAVYPFRGYVAEGGLLSYGIDQTEPYRLAAGYVDRILKGEKPADLPVQAPTKYELVINLKTAKALGLEIPSSVLARADEVIE
ncbi:MAG TPA: ABC transporter substrate-binding protein [Xanthobacteraceae bacterium]|nr:ABC transporter substrate-binding protein [Xanthobacteraceae bacterium]